MYLLYNDSFSLEFFSSYCCTLWHENKTLYIDSYSFIFNLFGQNNFLRHLKQTAKYLEKYSSNGVNHLIKI